MNLNDLRTKISEFQRISENELFLAKVEFNQKNKLQRETHIRTVFNSGDYFINTFKKSSSTIVYLSLPTFSPYLTYTY